MVRVQDILFGILAVALVVLLALHLRVAVLALVGAFLCGAIYLIAGMLPSATESFGTRAFTTGFLAIVLSSLVLILPGTLGATGPRAKEAVITIAAVLPGVAIAYEIVRTPRISRRILRWLALVLGRQ